MQQKGKDISMFEENYIRFDWAMKRLLRNKANHAVLEGLLFALIGKHIKIQQFLESEGNQEDELDKYNRVDILAEDDKGELIIIEIQNSHEITYFHRMLYGVSKAITEYIGKGDAYDKVRKIYSINIVYFELGQGKDYVYHGMTEFKGVHKPHDLLKLSAHQSERFLGVKGRDLEVAHDAGEVFPEYYILRVNDFDKVATTPLDEWIEFLKTGKIDAHTSTAGLQEAREQLRVDALTDKDKRAYYRYMESVRHMRSLFDTSRDDGYQDGIVEGRAKGRAEGRVEGRAEGRAEGELSKSLDIARNLLSLGLPISQIEQATGLTQEQIANLKDVIS